MMSLFMFHLRQVIQNSSVAGRKLLNGSQKTRKTCKQNEKKLNHEVEVFNDHPFKRPIIIILFLSTASFSVFRCRPHTPEIVKVALLIFFENKFISIKNQKFYLIELLKKFFSYFLSSCERNETANWDTISYYDIILEFNWKCSLSFNSLFEKKNNISSLHKR